MRSTGPLALALAFAFASGGLTEPRPASASPGSEGATTGATAAADPCLRRPLGPGDLIACAVASSPEIAASDLEIAAVAARRQSARSLLPSNPRIEVSLADRRAVAGDQAGTRNTNFYGTLSQELEVAGQRQRRLAVIDAEVEVARAAALARRRELAAAVLRHYYEALAAREERAMIARIARNLEGLAAMIQASEEAGVSSGLAAEVAGITVLRIHQRALAAQRRQETAELLLAGLLGLDPAAHDLELQGELVPLEIPYDLATLIAHGLETRAELASARAEAEAHRREAALFRRLRVPNPSLVVYGQRDGFFENVVGGGVGLSIPLPSPLGQTHRGVIAEAELRGRRADTGLAARQRRIRAEIVAAHRALTSRETELALYDDAGLQRLEAYLRDLSEEMAAGRLTIREGALLQLALLEPLEAAIAARAAHCLASVELAWAAALLLREAP